MPAAFAASASCAPAWRAFAVLSPSVSLNVETDASVTPLLSSTSCANRCRDERVTTRRGRSGEPATFLRSRKCRRDRETRRVAETPADRRACLRIDAALTSYRPFLPCGG